MKIPVQDGNKMYFSATTSLEGKKVMSASFRDGFWQGLSIGLGVAFFGMLVEFIVMIS